MSSGEREAGHPPPLGCWAHFLPQRGGQGVVPTSRTKCSFWFPVSLCISNLHLLVPTSFVVKTWFPCGRRGEMVSLESHSRPGKNIEHLGTTLSPENCPASLKFRLNITFSKSDDPLFLTSLLLGVFPPLQFYWCVLQAPVQPESPVLSLCQTIGPL